MNMSMGINANSVVQAVFRVKRPHCMGHFATNVLSTQDFSKMAHVSASVATSIIKKLMDARNVTLLVKLVTSSVPALRVLLPRLLVNRVCVSVQQAVC